MSSHPGLSNILSASIVAAFAALLAGCLLTPGKFASQLELRQAGTFSYSYEGEIHLLALSKLATMGEAAEEGFAAQPCYDDESSAERDCRADELAHQRRDWDEAEESRAAQREREAAATRAMLGGIDPADPAAAEELAERLRRQAGWRKVEFKGDGLFEVSFAISGRLDHDFVFPIIERFPMTSAFVQVVRREGDTVRVDAPGFSPQSAGGPFPGLMGGLSGMAGPDGEQLPSVPELNGTFTIVTDGEILANNTDEGPRQTASGKVLAWRINRRTANAPTALVSFPR